MVGLPQQGSGGRGAREGLDLDVVLHEMCFEEWEFGRGRSPMGRTLVLSRRCAPQVIGWPQS